MHTIQFVWLNGILVRVYSKKELRELLFQAMNA
jgi:hypothetical protein